jgi:hypothetical protein
MNDEGVIIIALGDSLYGGLAYNLAMSIKLNDPEANITLCHTPDTLKGWVDARMFDYVDNYIELSPEHYQRPSNGQVEYQRAKTLIYDLSPYRRTLYIDADTVWLPGRKVRWLFSELSGFFMGVKSVYDYNAEIYEYKNSQGQQHPWGDLGKMKKYFDLTDRLALHTSTLVYFEKDKKTKAMFDEAKRVYDLDDDPAFTWANGKADEYAFNIAIHRKQTENNEISPPVYINFDHGEMTLADVMGYYWMMTNGGTKVRRSVAEMYNKLVTDYVDRSGVPVTFLHQDKADVLKERQKL